MTERFNLSEEQGTHITKLEDKTIISHYYNKEDVKKFIRLV